MQDNPEGGELNPVEEVSAGAARRILPTRGKSGQFTADETGKGQFLRGNRRNVVEERVVRKISRLQEE